VNAESLNEKLGESAYERVQIAALELFAAQGFQGTGIRQIAREAGLSVASLYHYIGTKEELLEDFCRLGMQRLLEPAQEILETKADPVTLIIRLVELHVRMHADDQLLCLVTDTELRSLSVDRRSRIVSLRDMYEAMWTSTIDAGVSAGIFSVPDIKLAVFGILEMCTGVAYWYAPDGRLDLDEISRVFVRMTLSLLGADPGQVRPPGIRAGVARGRDSSG
jgi:TetR/AcrR family transcriptional regulator, cholesterol catabolism regulator